MIDHLTLHVSDLAVSRAFYVAALAPLGYEVLYEQEGQVVGMGAGGKPDLWLAPGGPMRPTLHLALTAPGRGAVDAFHAASLRAGARDNGAPGLRPHYHPNYYGAFVIDPDGNNLEAVCHHGG